MNQQQSLDFKKIEQWRDWLQKNHLEAEEAWVVLYKNNSKKQGLKYSEAVEEALCYGWIDGKISRRDENTYQQRFSPRKKNSTWSKSNKMLATKLINEGKMAEAGYQAIEEGKSSGRWQNT